MYQSISCPRAIVRAYLNLGPVPVVICNDCYLRQEEVECKEWSDRDSHVVSVQDGT